ncbi:MAG: hypothetical protein ACRCVJ_12295 [Clostridium sp.]|uniref:hypothetical protein n=1 Tax=Clostridium sp. TaxID=1506 RepID=UPI003F351017
MNPQGLMDLLDKKQLELSNMNIRLSKISEVKARSEALYRQELRKEILKLRGEKTPATLVNDLAKGKNEIATLRYKRDIAASNYYTQISAIENKRLEIEVLRSKLTWMRVEYQNG